MSTTKLKILVNNSFSQVVGLNAEQFRKLRAELSFKEDEGSAFYRKGFAYTTYLLDKKGYFPTGLLVRAVGNLIDQGLMPNVTYVCKAPSASRMHSLDLGDTIPYTNQINAARAALNANRGIVSMTTGYGKTLTIALLIHQAQVKTLVIVPTLELKRQLTKVFTGYFGTLKNIVIENIDSSRLNKLTDFDMLIIDETHHSAAKTYRRLNKAAWGKIYYRFGFTATPFRTNSNENILLESISGNVVYQVTYKQAVAEGAVVPIEAYYYELPKVKTNAYTYREVYSELVVNNGYRNAIISDLITNLLCSGASTLCLVREIAHGVRLEELTGCRFANGQDELTASYIEEFNAKSITCLIGTNGVLSEGVDTRPCEYVIIAGLGKSKPNLMQAIGRCVRKYQNKTSGKVILFKDPSHKYTAKHFNAQAKILLDEYGVKVIKLDV